MNLWEHKSIEAWASTVEMKFRACLVLGFTAIAACIITLIVVLVRK